MEQVTDQVAEWVLVPKHYTIIEAAEELGVTPGAIRNAISTGRIACEMKYNRKVISSIVLEEYRARTQVGGVKKAGRPRVERPEEREAREKEEAIIANAYVGFPVYMKLSSWEYCRMQDEENPSGFLEELVERHKAELELQGLGLPPPVIESIDIPSE